MTRRQRNAPIAPRLGALLVTLLAISALIVLSALLIAHVLMGLLSESLSVTLELLMSHG